MGHVASRTCSDCWFLRSAGGTGMGPLASLASTARSNPHCLDQLDLLIENEARTSASLKEALGVLRPRQTSTNHAERVASSTSSSGCVAAMSLQLERAGRQWRVSSTRLRSAPPLWAMRCSSVQTAWCSICWMHTQILTCLTSVVARRRSWRGMQVFSKSCTIMQPPFRSENAELGAQVTQSVSSSGFAGT